MSKLTRFIAVILFLAVGVIAFLPTLSFTSDTVPDSLLEMAVKQAGGSNPTNMWETGNGGKIASVAIAAFCVLGILLAIKGKGGIAFVFGLLCAGLYVGVLFLAKDVAKDSSAGLMDMKFALLGWIGCGCSVLAAIFSLLSKEHKE